MYGNCCFPKIEGRFILLNFFVSSVAKHDFRKLMLQGTAKSLSTSKTSRISLIDLAGLDRDEVDDGGSQCPRESRHVDKSLSQLK